MDDDVPAPDTGAFPDESITWLLGADPCSVLVIGGAALAYAVEGAGHRVVPVAAGAPFGAEDHSCDVVLAQHTLPGDLSEVARVLRPEGLLALVVSDRDQRIPWARKLDAALGATPVEAPAEAVATSALFGDVEEATHPAWQTVNRDDLAALLPTLPEMTALDEAERASRVAAALDLYDGYGRGIDGMQLPWLSRCFRATVVEGAYVPPPAPTPETAERGDEPTAPEWVGEDTQPITGVLPSKDEASFTFRADEFDDTGLLLIDFR